LSAIFSSIFYVSRRGAAQLAQSSQFSTVGGKIRLNSFVLSVTSVSPNARAWAPIKGSLALSIDRWLEFLAVLARARNCSRSSRRGTTARSPNADDRAAGGSCRAGRGAMTKLPENRIVVVTGGSRGIVQRFRRRYRPLSKYLDREIGHV
jgi:hypothetical protein